MLVYTDLDSVPGGAFSDENSALKLMAEILDQRIGHYNPIVAFAPESCQPMNSPVKPAEDRKISAGDKITALSIDTTGGIPIAGAAPPNTGVLTSADVAMTYNNTEGRIEA